MLSVDMIRVRAMFLTERSMRRGEVDPESNELRVISDDSDLSGVPEAQQNQVKLLL